MLKDVWVRLSVVAFVCCLSVTAHAMADQKSRVNVPAGDLTAGLEMLAKQSGAEFVYRADQLKGLRTHGVAGDLSPKEAVTQLLIGTPLQLHMDASGAMLIAPPSASATAQVSPALGHDEGEKEGKKSSSAGFPVAQVDQGQAQGASTVESERSTKGDSDKLEEVTVKLPEILIKGSRIMNVDVKRTEDDVQPYYILDSKQIEQSGATNVEDFLKQRLTMNTTIRSNSQAYPGFTLAGSTSTVNLRGLGSNETLILINGRRSAGVNLQVEGGVNQPDINGIPLSAIERIEVLPSSASAIYGGAAVGGVVNIILKKNFQGADFNVIYENTVDGNAPLRTVEGTYGFSLADGKTQVMLAGHYSDGETLLLQDRLDLFQRGVSTILKNFPFYFIRPLLPFPGATTNIAGVNASGKPTNLTLKDGTPLNSSITFIPTGAAPGSNLSAGLLSNAGSYNLNPAPSNGKYGLQGPMGTVPREKSFMATVRQEFTPVFEGFTEFSTKSNASRTSENPIGSSGFPYFVPATAPDNPFQQAVYVNIPTSVSPPDTTDSVTQSVTVGLLARLPHDWRSELDYTWSRNSFETTLDTSLDSSLGAALAAGTINPFVDTIAYPLNLAPYLAPANYSGRSTLNDLGLRTSGPIGSLPWGRPSLTIGLEHRKEGSDDSNYYVPLDPATTIHLLYFGQSQSTDSIYAEAQVPLVTAKNALPWIHSLDLQLAGRSEHYTVNAGTPYVFVSPTFAIPFSPPQGVHTTVKYTSTNPTFGLKYRPVEELTLRVSYAKAFLPPTFSQLLLNPVPDRTGPYISIVDPRNGLTYDVNTTSGGNPNLKPQTARDWDIGAIWEPQATLLNGLRIDLEYYKITQPDYITTPSPQQVVSNPAYASRVTRDPVTGLITIVNVSFLNATEYKTNGWDMTINYRRPTAFGTFDFYALGTVIEHDQRQYTIGGPFLDYAGYPADGGEGKIKANATLSWEYRGLKLGWTTTYFGNYRQYYSPGSPNYLQFGPFTNIINAQGSYTIPSQTYHEIFASYTFNKAAGEASGLMHGILSNLTVQVGIKNLFNTLPPFDAYYNPYYYSPYGDPRLRDYRISIRKSL